MKAWFSVFASRLLYRLNPKPMIKEITIELSTHFQDVTIVDDVIGKSYCAGIQDEIRGYKTPEHLQVNMDHEYWLFYDYEADLPIVKNWLEIIPPTSMDFLLAVLFLHIQARYPSMKFRSKSLLELFPNEIQDVTDTLGVFFNSIEQYKESKRPVWKIKVDDEMTTYYKLSFLRGEID
jgi:hypothetical protein